MQVLLFFMMDDHCVHRVIALRKENTVAGLPSVARMRIQ